MLNEAVDAILRSVGKLVEEGRNDTKTGLVGVRTEMNKRFDKLEAKVTQTKTELKDEVE